jgi:hypothetical protein
VLRLLAMGGAAFLRDVEEASRILKALSGGCDSLTTCLNGGLGLQEAGPLLRTETRIFKGVVEARGIGAGTVRRCWKILALCLTERKAGIKFRAALRLWARLAIITSGLALRYLEVARRTLLHASRAGGLPRGLRDCDFDACVVGTSRNRGGKKYGANRRMGEQVQPCFHDSHLILRARPQRYDGVLDGKRARSCQQLGQKPKRNNALPRPFRLQQRTFVIFKPVGRNSEAYSAAFVLLLQQYARLLRPTAPWIPAIRRSSP